MQKCSDLSEALRKNSTVRIFQPAVPPVHPKAVLSAPLGGCRCPSSGRSSGVGAGAVTPGGAPRLLSPGTGSSPTWVFPQHVENQARCDGCFPREVCLPELMGCAGSSFPSVSGSHVRSTCFSSRTIANTQPYISSAFNEGITP